MIPTSQAEFRKILNLPAQDMKFPRMKALAAFLMILFGAVGCTGVGGIGSYSLTNQLAAGMSRPEVEAILGKPSSTQFREGHYLAKYSLQKPFVGWIPVYLAFNAESNTLVSWRENLAEYHATQNLWLKALPPTQRVHATHEYRLYGF